jgi:hypothetical protein
VPSCISNEFFSATGGGVNGGMGGGAGSSDFIGGAMISGIGLRSGLIIGSSLGESLAGKISSSRDANFGCGLGISGAAVN